MIAVESHPMAPRSKRGDPVWDLAFLYPAQGQWTEEEYLDLRTKRMIELSDGCLEILPVATLFHQFIVLYLFRLLDDFVRSRNLGAVASAPVPVRLGPGKLREPDVFFLRPERMSSTRTPPDGADLIIEVLSEGNENRDRDLITKRREYADAAVPEYWIVDPENRTLTVLTLNEREYIIYMESGLGAQARSKLLDGFVVDVTSTFAAAERS